MSTSQELFDAKGNPEKFQEIVDRKRSARMREIDALPPELRACVHDYGWTVVFAFMQGGVQKPKRIRHLVETVLNEFSPTRGSFSAQGVRGDGHGLKDLPVNRSQHDL